MLFQFAPVIEAGIKSGLYEIVRNPVTGQLLGIARDKVTGRFVAHAVGMTTKAAAGLIIDPLIAPTQLVLGGIQMIQTHIGFQETYRKLDVICGWFTNPPNKCRSSASDYSCNWCRNYSRCSLISGEPPPNFKAERRRKATEDRSQRRLY